MSVSCLLFPPSNQKLSFNRDPHFFTLSRMDPLKVVPPRLDTAQPAHVLGVADYCRIVFNTHEAG
jgi:hypothetical protein